MDKKQFKIFCDNYFKNKGFKKQNKCYYLNSDTNDILCALVLQKSNYGDVYYVNFYYFIGIFDTTNYPTIYESDIGGRIVVMSKTETIGGKHFPTALIEYEEYSEEELNLFFDKEFDERVLPPLYEGKKYILDNLNKKYSLTLNREEVLKKLQS